MLPRDTLLDNRYRTVELLGTGAMGSVYLALDERLSCSVAVKGTIYNRFKLAPEAENELRRAFEREAKLLANLQHEAIPRVSDFFAAEGEQFLVMEYITGADLHEQFLKRRDGGGNFETKTVVDWTCQLLDALNYLHTQPEPIIHKDIKLGNLKVTKRGKIKLLDFGVAKGFAGEMTRVEVGSLQMGTEDYAPLEQFLKFPSASATTLRHALEIKHADRVERLLNEQTDARSDLYSLAVTMYRLLTGKSPTEYLPRTLALWEGKPDPIIPIHELNKDVPATVSQVLMRALNLEKTARWESAAQMRFELDAAWQATRGGERTNRGSQQTNRNGELTDSRDGRDERAALEQLLEAERTRRAAAERELARLQNFQPPPKSNSFAARLMSRGWLILIGVGLLALTTLAFTWGMSERAARAARQQKYEAHFNQGWTALKAKNFDAAISEFGEAIKIKPDATDALLNRAEAYQKNQNFNRAVADYAAVVKADSKNIYARTNRAAALCQKGDYELAFEDFELVAKLKADYDFLYEKRGFCHETRKMYPEALADYDRALSLDAKENWTHFRRGVVRLFLNSPAETEKAVADFTEAIKLTPDDWASYANRALAYESLGKKSLSQADLRRAEELKKPAAP